MPQDKISGLVEIIQALNSTKLPFSFHSKFYGRLVELNEEKFLSSLKIARDSYETQDPEIVGLNSGICMHLDKDHQHMMDHWYRVLNIQGWDGTTYWLAPAYDHASWFNQACEERVELCEALINNIKSQMEEDNG